MAKINTLQGLRFFAFLSIFLLHTQKYHFMKFFYNAAWGVSFFIILSGFLSGYRYCNYHRHCKYIDIKGFTLNKIKKYYPLHLCMLTATIPFSGIYVIISRKDFSGFIAWFYIFTRNVLLLQGYFNRDYFSFNGVSWFLSLMVLLTIITMPLMMITSKINKTQNGNIKLVLCMLVLIIIDTIYILYVKNSSLNFEYWLYIFPPSRIPEYACGLITGFIIRQNEGKIIFKNFTLLEIISIIGLIVIIKFFTVYEWLWRGIIWIIPNTFLIAIFCLEKGKVSKLLSNKLFVWLGNITFEAFLIHIVIIKYFSLLFPATTLSILAKLAAEVCIFILTISTSNFMHSLSKRTSSIKDNMEKSLTNS